MPRLTRFFLVALGLIAGGVIAMSLDHLQGQAPGASPPSTGIPKEFASYRDIVKQVMPAVVSLESKAAKKKPKTVKKDDKDLDSGKQNDAPRDKPKSKPREEDDKSDTLGYGSGVIIDATGVIVTNFHVVEGAATVTVTLADGRTYDSTDIRRDPKTDLAVLRIKADKPLPFLEFTDSDTIEVGDRVLAIGSPFGFTGTVTHGIISAKGRSNQRINQYEDFLQTDAAINPGNSGGPLIGLDGRIVGINSNIATRTGSFSGIGLTISANLAKEVTKQLLEHGSVKRGYVGVGIRDLDPAVATKLGITGGVVITKVYGDTPAEKAGLKTGDVVASVGGITMKDANSWPRIVAGLPLSKPAELKIFRDDKPMTVSVTILEQPEDFGQDRGGSGPLRKGEGLDIGSGITVMELTEELSKQFGYEKGTRGIVISSVAKDSAGAKAGLSRGMIIQKIDTYDINTADKALKGMNAATKEKGAAFQIVKPNGEIDFITVAVK